MQPIHEPLETLAEEFLLAWQQAHGFPATQACTLVGPKHVAILMEGIFSRAERKLAEDQNGEMLLRRYSLELFGDICDQMADRIEQITGQDVHSKNLNFDPATDQVVIVFRLDGPPETTPNDDLQGLEYQPKLDLKS